MTDDAKGKRDYDVGYGKPPKSTRFKKGHKGYLRRKPRPGDVPGPSMTEAVDKKVIIRDAAGKPRSTTFRDLINSNWATRAAKGEAKAAEVVFRQLERERAHAPAGIANNSLAADSGSPTNEKPRRSYSQVMSDFAVDMWEETYRMNCDEGRKHVTDKECSEATLKYILDNYVECKQRYASELDYRIFILMLTAVPDIKLRPYIKPFEPRGIITSQLEPSPE